jgi:hypothetical protein
LPACFRKVPTVPPIAPAPQIRIRSGIPSFLSTDQAAVSL